MKDTRKTEIYIFDNKQYCGKIRTTRYKNEVLYLFSEHRVEGLPVRMIFSSSRDTSANVILVASKSKLTHEQIMDAIPDQESALNF